MKVEESLNVTFDETPPSPKTLPLEDDDLVKEEAIKVFRNKLDENGVVSRNKARLVAQGYNQQKGIDYDEIYAPVARLEFIRILLAYACTLDFKLFQMDVKSAFLNGFINEEVYVAQPLGFIDFTKPNHVYRLKKALYGLKQAPKAWYNILKVFLIKHDYTMGMKQTSLAISTTEAEYVSAGKACQQALWMKQALVDYGIKLDDIPIMCDDKGAIDLSKNPVQHSHTKHIELRHHFLRENVQKGNISIKKVSSEDNIADILTKPLKKENGLLILQSIDQGPFELGTTRNTLGTTPEGGVLLGPERPRTYEDLSDTEKKRYDADVRATNIVLQGLPKDIYKLINHNIEAKAIWDNVKMLLAGSELTKEDRESQLYDEFERFKMLPGENINEYHVRFHKLVNNMRNIRMAMPNIQLNSKFVNNMSPEWDRFVTAVKLNKGLKETNHEQLYAYLKQHEKHAAQDRLIIERITPATNDQLAFVSTVQPHAQSSHVQSHQYPSSSTNHQSLQYPNSLKHHKLIPDTPKLKKYLTT
ncbi:retrovirus-related pol polyprotein from transposon TNT 1-94 [Tanacetum coccineum]